MDRKSLAIFGLVLLVCLLFLANATVAAVRIRGNQVRGVDYLAAGLTIALGGFAIADIAYLNISERTGEIGTLRATGWGDNHLRRLFGTEAILTAAIGAVSGAIVGVTATAVLLPMDLATTLTAAATAAVGGILAAAALAVRCAD